MMKLIRFKSFLFVFAIVVSGWGHAEVYKWVDENGKVHFGDRPPAKVDAKALDLPETKKSKTPQVSDIDRKERQRKLVQALEEERKQKLKVKQDKKDEKAKRLAACKQLKGRIKHSETISRYFRYDNEGERTYYTEQEADAFRAKLKKTYKENCES